MKIAIDARTLGSKPSGIGMYLNDFLKQLVKYEEFEFVLLTDVAVSEYINAFKENGVEIRAWGTSVYKSTAVISYFKFIQSELDEIKPDIFWEVNTVIPQKLKGDFKVMVTIHDMFPIEYVRYFGWIYSLYFKYGIKRTLKNTDMILYNSEQTKETTEKYFKEARNIKNCNAYIIANPLKDEWEITDGDYLLYVGNMEKRKGVDLLLKAYPIYRKMGGTKELVLAGKMQEDDIAALLTRTIDNMEGVQYLNYVTHDKKHQLFADCSCFVFPSKAEGFGMPIIEVMKFGKPILVSDIPIFDEVAGDCINKFELNASPKQQAENLAKAMLEYNPEVNTDAYDEIINRYAPDKLGKIVRDFVIESMNN